MSKILKLGIVSLFSGLMAIAGSFAVAQSTEELASQIEELKEQIDALEEAMSSGGGMVDGWWSNTQLGGYGELHYMSGGQDGGKGDNKIDFHRYVLFISHDFNDSIRMFSEFELEHSIAGEGKAGEIELEQAYIEMDLSDNSLWRAGLFLIPVGIMNETHEPPTFYGVERNSVEKYVIPTTWWEGGALYSKTWDAGIQLDTAIHSGLNYDSSNPTLSADKLGSIRSGRQKVGSAIAEDHAYTVRVKYTGIPGMEMAGYWNRQTDMAQSQETTKHSATMVGYHMIYAANDWDFRFLSAGWEIDNAALKANGKNKTEGYYAQLGRKFSLGESDLGLFFRTAMYDTVAGDSDQSEINIKTMGFNWWPHERVVLKADHQKWEYDATPAKNDTIINLGVGYMF